MLLKLLSNADYTIQYNFIFSFDSSVGLRKNDKAARTHQLKYELKSKYGDLYDLTLVEYINTRTPINLICKNHGVFEQHYLAHHHDGGCRKCKQQQKEQNLISQFKQIHGDRYDYSHSEFDKTKVSAHCKKHGVFWVTISSHAKSLGAGCQKCRIAEQESKLIEQFRNVHGYRYDYSGLQFCKNAVKVNIRCSEHGVFKQLASAHREGQGCPKCVGRLNEDDLKTLFNKVHQNNYIYGDISNTQRRTRINVVCSKHDVFKISIGAHLDGLGCPKCKK